MLSDRCVFLWPGYLCGTQEPSLGKYVPSAYLRTFDPPSIEYTFEQYTHFYNFYLDMQI